jgi:RNA polymerase sigma-70 factor (ECF subfamily)
MEEGDLIRRAKAGARDAAAELCRLHWQAVYRVVYRRLGNRAEAEDLTQETFLRFWRQIDRFEGERLGPYLRTIALNLCRNRLRDSHRHPAVELTEERRADPGPSAEQHLLASEEAQRLRSALGALEPDQRRVLELRLIEGQSAAEAGRELGRTPEAVRALQYRALIRLRGMLAAETAGGEG